MTLTRYAPEKKSERDKRFCPNTEIITIEHEFSFPLTTLAWTDFHEAYHGPYLMNNPDPSVERHFGRNESTLAWELMSWFVSFPHLQEKVHVLSIRDIDEAPDYMNFHCVAWLKGTQYDLELLVAMDPGQAKVINGQHAFMDFRETPEFQEIWKETVHVF